MHRLILAKDLRRLLCRFPGLFLQVALLQYSQILVALAPLNSDLLSSVRFPFLVLLSRKCLHHKAKVIVGLTSFISLFPAYCPMSENSCFIYFVNLSSCLWQEGKSHRRYPSWVDAEVLKMPTLKHVGKI